MRNIEDKAVLVTAAHNERGQTCYRRQTERCGNLRAAPYVRRLGHCEILIPFESVDSPS